MTTPTHNQDETARRRKGVVRTALVLGAVALAVYVAFILSGAHIGYLPTDKVIGISKLARVVDGYARRFQIQEKLTAQIAHCIDDVLKPRGVAVVIDAVHPCMTTRGVHKRGVSMVTSQMLGTFREDARTRAEFLQFIDGGARR